MRKATKIIWGVILALILLLAAAGYFKFYFGLSSSDNKLFIDPTRKWPEIGSLS